MLNGDCAPFTFIARESAFLEDSFTERVKIFSGAHGYRTSEKIKFVFSDV